METNQIDFAINGYSIPDVLIFDTLEIPAITVDSAFKIQAMNVSAGYLIGKAPDACLGINYSDLIKIKDTVNGKDPLTSVMELAKPMSGEAVAQVNGSGFPVKYGVTPIFDKNGSVTGVIKYLVDQRPKNIVQEVLTLENEITEGNLSARVDPSLFEGDERTILNKINNILDAVVSPLNVAAEYVEKISKGDIPDKITDNYNGDFNAIKNNLNQCIDAVNLLVSDAKLLSDAAIEGALKTRADASLHQGDFRKIVEGVNSTLDEVIGPLDKISEVLKRMAVNDYTQRLPDDYKGDFALVANDFNEAMIHVNNVAVSIVKISNGDLSELDEYMNVQKRSDEDITIPAIIRALKTLKGLKEELERLTIASEAGKLSERGNPEQFSGAYAEVIEGTNQMLDAILLPIGEGNRVLKQISDGRIDELIVQTYQGDHELMKKAVNNVAVVLQNLQNEIARLTEASKQGKLSERGKPEQFSGAYAEVIEGTNQMLDAILLPIGEGNRILRQIRGGNLREKVEIHCQGDHEEMKDAINGVYNWLSDLIKYVTLISEGDMSAEMEKASEKDQIHEHLIRMRENIKALVLDANMLAKAAIEGRLDTRADASRHDGDFRKIVDGVNNTLDSVIGPLNVAAEYVDRISKGDIPAKITDTYNGDFNEIKNNLNQCIDAVNLLVSDARMLSVAAVEGRLDTRADATRHSGDFRIIVEGVNSTLDEVIGPLNKISEVLKCMAVNDYTQKLPDNYNGDFALVANDFNDAMIQVNNITGSIVKISNGDLSELDEYLRIQKRSDQDITVPAIIRALQTLKSLKEELERLTIASEAGKLSERGKPELFSGAYAEVIEGTNQMLDAILLPIGEGNRVLKQISDGRIDELIVQTYLGDHEEMKKAVNNVAVVLQNLQNEIARLTEASKQGKLSERGKPELFNGAYAEVILGTNQMLDAILLPIAEGNRILRQIRGGNLREKVEIHCLGDHEEMKDAINGVYLWLSDLINYVTMIAEGDMSAEMQKASEKDQIHEHLIRLRENIKALVMDANMLAKAAVDGKLDTRADASRHEGDFRKIVEGVNDTLDSVIGPLNIAAEYVDRIAKGDIPDKITDNYNGDFNEIKINLNQCIEAVTLLVSDAKMLSVAAVEGRLDTRADASRHGGDFRKIVEGVNDTLDSVIGPLNIAAEYVDRISKGDIPAKITDTYNGDFNEIKNNLNQCIEAVTLLVSDAKMLSVAAVEGRLSTRADASRHEGDFRRIVEGVNSTLDEVIGPLNKISEVLKCMAVNDYTQRLPDNYNGDFALVANDFNDAMIQVNNITGSIVKISNGDLSELDEYLRIQKRSDQDITVPAIIRALKTLKDLKEELERLTIASEAGKLSERGKPELFSGAYAEVIEGTNQMLDAILLPIGEGNRVLKQISDGRIDELITQTYQGDHELMKKAVNNVAVVLQNLQNEIGRLTEASKQGKLSERGKPELFNGAYAEVILGTNQMLDAILLPIAEGNRILRQIRGGNLREKVEIHCLGDHAEMKDAINGVYNWLSDLVKYVTMIAEGDMSAEMQKASDKDQIHEHLIRLRENIKALVMDANMLAKAAVDGKLDTRADASRHEGDFRKIVEGVNDTLDSVIGPLNIAAKYVDRISKGDIPDKITNNYNGDFNEIKNNLNQCIDAVNLLVSDAKMLSVAAVEGRLDTRADASHHKGDFRKIVEGVNDTLNAVIEPLMEAMRVAESYAKADFSSRVAENIKVSGDFIKFKSSLNNIGVNITLAVKEIQRVTDEYANGNFSATFDEKQNIEGDLTTLKQSLNNIGVQISAAMRLVNQKISVLASDAEKANASIEEVTAGTQKIAESTGIVSSNAETGSQGINQVIRAMEDLNVTVGSVSQKTEKVSTNSEKVNEFAQNGVKLAKKSEESMENITRSVNEVDQIVKDINRQMAEIGKIVNLISDISRQTNLLALNAAIEAARVGEAGRGFAVVASEVKALAQESRQSAEGIANMITDLQHKTEKANNAMETTNETVSEGSRNLIDTVKAFNQIADSISEISKTIADVASASEEQAATVEEVTASINEVSQLVQNTAKEAGDSAAATEEAAASIAEVSSIIANVNEVAGIVSQEMNKFKV